MTAISFTFDTLAFAKQYAQGECSAQLIEKKLIAKAAIRLEHFAGTAILLLQKVVLKLNYYRRPFLLKLIVCLSDKLVAIAVPSTIMKLFSRQQSYKLNYFNLVK